MFILNHHTRLDDLVEISPLSLEKRPAFASEAWFQAQLRRQLFTIDFIFDYLFTHPSVCPTVQLAFYLSKFRLYVFMHVRTDICTWKRNKHVSTHAFMLRVLDGCMDVWMDACMHACMHACMCKYTKIVHLCAQPVCERAGSIYLMRKHAGCR